MKNYKFKYILILLLFPWTACSDYVDGINESPNSATDAPMEALITASQVYMMGVFESEDARLATMWAQQFTGSDRQYSSYNEYSVTSEVFTFFNAYVGAIKPALEAQMKAEEIGNQVTVGMCKVMRAMTFGYMTALYGDIPYTEANQYPEIQNPVYDSQSSVYENLQALLSDAITDLQSDNGGISVDIFYGGDASVWAEVANTLKARFYLHTGKYTDAIAAATNGISSPSNDMLTSHGTTTSSNQNTWYDFHEIQRSGYLTAAQAYLPKLLDSSQPEYRGNAKTDESDRFNFIYTGSAGNYDLNVSDNGMFAVDAPMRMASYYENQLIIAEAQLRKSSPDANAALAALNNVRSELADEFSGGTYDSYVLTDFAPAGIANNGEATAAEALLNEIIEEKYISLVGQTEVFNDLRRLNNPLGLTPTNGSKLPERFLYPTDEVNSNENVPDPLPGLFDPTSVNK